MEHCRQVCAKCGATVSFSLNAKCGCGGTLLVEYDLERLRKTWPKSSLVGRGTSMWRYRELLPVKDERHIVSLGEGWTPLLRLEGLERRLGLKRVWVKREEQNPTGSFKARGFSAAVSLMREHGIRYAAVPSNGNAASALAAYAARADMKAAVFVPKDCPGVIVGESVRYGASVYIVDGLIHDAAAIVEAGRAEQGWFHAGTLKEPGRVEGKKTMGLELAEQLDWKLPDVIVYPTGGGSGIVGLWKAFRELHALGWIEDRFPRLVSVQEEGCTPIVDRVRQEPESRSGCVFPPSPSPTGLRVPEPPDGELIAGLIRKTGGTAVAVTADEIAAAQRIIGGCGISSSPEGAAAAAGTIRLAERGWIAPDESVAIFNTAHADKYVHWQPEIKLPVIRSYADFIRLGERTGI
ncbi:threonine synthase [Paenibacillus humicola]|uniref:threonine synthase n=1 Tax=Paenibacillus humicola TaxID=3110540 RepID=UPI00237B7358|nr:threonine synthase [Paenibacillus humicola]